jgi:hypothetical protein
MLEAWMIERLKREQQEREPPRPELRIEIEPPPMGTPPPQEEEKSERGVWIIEL